MPMKKKPDNMGVLSGSDKVLTQLVRLLIILSLKLNTKVCINFYLLFPLMRELKKYCSS